MIDIRHEDLYVHFNNEFWNGRFANLEPPWHEHNYNSIEIISLANVRQHAALFRMLLGISARKMFSNNIINCYSYCFQEHIITLISVIGQNLSIVLMFSHGKNYVCDINKPECVKLYINYAFVHQLIKWNFSQKIKIRRFLWRRAYLFFQKLLKMIIRGHK